MNKEQIKKHQTFFNTRDLAINVNLRTARNTLWCPAYNEWTKSGGFDYRSYVRDTFIACLSLMANADGALDPKFDLILPCLSHIDFPRSMGDVSVLLAENLFNFFEEMQKNGVRIYATPFNALDGSISLRQGLNYELLIIREHVNSFVHVDPFPPNHPWAASQEELDFLSLMLFPLKKAIEKQLPNGTPVIAGVLNVNTMRFDPAVDDEQLLFDMFKAIDAILRKPVFKDTTKEQIMEEFNHG